VTRRLTKALLAFAVAGSAGLGLGALTLPTASAEATSYGTDVAQTSAGAVASSSGREVSYALGPELAIDAVWDSDASRWSGEPADDGWFQVKLAQPDVVDHVSIQWSTSCPKQYKLQVSNDGVNWTDATRVLTPPACRAWDTTDLSGLGQPYQYVRMQGIQRSLSYGYSINEFEVWDGPAPPAPQVTTGAVTGLSPTTATLNGQVVPAGADTSYQFEYGVAGSGPWGTGKVPATAVDVGSEPTAHDVTETLTGLSPGTTYLYRLATRTGAEPGYGAELSFTTPPPAPVPVANDITPAPASMAQDDAAPPFVLTPRTRIVARGAAVPVAAPLAERLRRATGFTVPLTAGPVHGPATGDIQVVVDPRVTINGFAGNPAAYRLDVSTAGIRIAAASQAGAFYGEQSLRQLFPAFVESPSPVHVAWSVPDVHIADGPRFGYRGIMLDLARNFLSVDEIKRFIDQMSYLKMNVLHLHLSDDQGWRIQITNSGRAPGDNIDYQKLTEVSGSTAIAEGGTDGLPGHAGFLTQAQYRQVVAYAGAHFISVIPEIDLPGHSSAILHAVPQLNTAHSVPQPPPGQDTIPANTTQQVGESSLDTHAEVTYTFLAHVFRQLAQMTPGRYLGVGGDEAYSTSGADFDHFMNRVIGLVHAVGKSTTGWNLSYADETTSLTSDDLIQYYNGSDQATAVDAKNNGSGVIVSYYPYTYLDYPYSAGDVEKYYNWDPAATVPDVPTDSISGVEDPLWTETVRSDAEAEHQTWPRAAATAEIGWSPRASLNEPEFSARLAMLGDRWTLEGTNFDPDPRVPWQIAAAGIDHTFPITATTKTVHLGTVLAPGTSLDDVTVKINWGDGATPADADVTLAQPADNTHVNGAYEISGRHDYRTPGSYTGHILATGPNGSTDAPFTVRVSH
jgi:hexosaminidase